MTINEIHQELEQAEEQYDALNSYDDFEGDTIIPEVLSKSFSEKHNLIVIDDFFKNLGAFEEHTLGSKNKYQSAYYSVDAEKSREIENFGLHSNERTKEESYLEATKEFDELVAQVKQFGIIEDGKIIPIPIFEYHKEIIHESNKVFELPTEIADEIYTFDQKHYYLPIVVSDNTVINVMDNLCCEGTCGNYQTYVELITGQEYINKITEHNQTQLDKIFSDPEYSEKIAAYIEQHSSQIVNEEIDNR